MLRPETIQRAFYLWGRLSEEYRVCKDPYLRAAIHARKVGIRKFVVKASIVGVAPLGSEGGNVRQG